ncbi:MAG: hypothetical protein H6728_16715 [Myxococcales bacterium]|nr:hypothetical protein [Myxococcales bacterium]
MRITAYSKALLSNWFYLEPLHLLFDAGEGLGLFLESRALGIHDVFLSHAHIDHFTGLRLLIMMRRRGIFQSEQSVPPLRVSYPATSGVFQRLFAYFSSEFRDWEQMVELNPMMPGDRVPLRYGRELEVIAMEAKHVDYDLCLAYRISQTRLKLRPEYVKLGGQAIRELIQEKGREAMSDVVEVPVVAFSGDGKPLEDEPSRGAMLLIHEATFLDPDTSYVHSTLTEAIEAFVRLEAERLLLFHFSVRYTAQEIMAALDTLVTDAALRERIHVVLPGQLFDEVVPTKMFG